jgi:hypothetical protein
MGEGVTEGSWSANLVSWAAKYVVYTLPAEFPMTTNNSVIAHRQPLNLQAAN